MKEPVKTRFLLFVEGSGQPKASLEAWCGENHYTLIVSFTVFPFHVNVLKIRFIRMSYCLGFGESITRRCILTSGFRRA